MTQLQQNNLNHLQFVSLPNFKDFKNINNAINNSVNLDLSKNLNINIEQNNGLNNNFCNISGNELFNFELDQSTESIITNQSIPPQMPQESSTITKNVNNNEIKEENLFAPNANIEENKNMRTNNNNEINDVLKYKDMLKSLEEKLKNEYLINKEQNNYIEILKQTINNCLLKNGNINMNDLDKASKQLNKNPIDMLTEYTSLKSQNEIIKCLSPSFPKNSNLRREVISSLKNNIFTQLKKNSKYELNTEECAFYLKTYKDKDKEDSSISNNSNEKASLNQPIISPVINFPEIENKTVYFTPDENQQNTNLTMEEENFDSSFTFGEQSLIKVSGNKNSPYIKDENELKNISNDTEELENKALEKYIPEFDFVFDENKYFKNLAEESEQFLNVYKSSNNNEINVNKLSEDIKKLNLLIEKFNVKTNPFDKIGRAHV